MWKYTPWDSLLVLITCSELALKIGWGLYAESAPLWLNLMMVSLLVFLYFYNFIVVNHEFMHTSFFNSKRLNNFYLVLSSANLMYPMSIIKAGHNDHHIYNNDKLKNGTTQDLTSTWLMGKKGQQEHFLPYALLGFFRQNAPSELKKMIPELKTKSFGQFLYYEIGFALLVCSIICFINWQWFLFGILPTMYFGWVLTDTQNYFEHHRATDPENRYANSVSYYGKIYNFFWFNEGYHQEHHLEPTCHWTERPSLRQKNEELFKSNNAYEASVPAMYGFFDKGVSQRKTSN